MSDKNPVPGDFIEFNKNLIEEFRSNDGKLGGRYENADLLLLTTTGAKSGKQRVSPVSYFTVDGKIIISGTYRGSATDPGWVHNLRADPRVHLEVRTDSGVEVFDATARELPPAEREDILPKFIAASPVHVEYQAKTSRVIPLFELRRA